MGLPNMSWKLSILATQRDIHMPAVPLSFIPIRLRLNPMPIIQLGVLEDEKYGLINLHCGGLG